MPHDPSKLFYQTDFTRRSIIFAYWLVVLLAVPLWWRTTSIERLALPSSRVISQTRQSLKIPVKIGLEANSHNPKLVTQLRKLVSAFIQQSPARWEGLDVDIYETATIRLKEADSIYTVVDGEDIDVQKRQLTFPTRDTTSIPSLAETLSFLIAPLTSPWGEDNRIAPYSPQYRLSFTLLNEDAAAGRHFANWDVRSAILHHIMPILTQLSVLHNFTIESQVQLHAPLAFTPLSLDSGYGITPEDLTVFVNSAEWTLSSSASNDPVLHFVVFVPSASRGPLFILDHSGDVSPSTSFLLPQWGGIVILNPDESLHQPSLSSYKLDAIFSTFSSHLSVLLGAPSLPPIVKRSKKHHHTFTDWQIDALLRYRALSNARGSKETLQSIINLVDQIEGMPVGHDVKGDIQGALTAFEKMLGASTTSLTEIFRLSTQSLVLSSRAFFNPGMLALLYFPAEHTYAVYTPLFASAGIPMVIATLREISSWRKQRKATAIRSDGVDSTS